MKTATYTLLHELLKMMHKEVWGRQKRKLEIYRTTFLQRAYIRISQLQYWDISYLKLNKQSWIWHTSSQKLWRAKQFLECRRWFRSEGHLHCHLISDWTTNKPAKHFMFIFQHYLWDQIRFQVIIHECGSYISWSSEIVELVYKNAVCLW